LQIGDTLEFVCVNEECDEAVRFSIFKVSKNLTVSCPACGNEYKFTKNLVDKIIKFEKLCLAVNEAEDILSDTKVSIDVSGHNVKVPFRLLLTRLNTQLDLDIKDKQIKIKFRMTPLESEVNNSSKIEDAKAVSG